MFWDDFKTPFDFYWLFLMTTKTFCSVYWVLFNYVCVMWISEMVFHWSKKFYFKLISHNTQCLISQRVLKDLQTQAWRRRRRKKEKNKFFVYSICLMCWKETLSGNEKGQTNIRRAEAGTEIESTPNKSCRLPNQMQQRTMGLHGVVAQPCYLFVCIFVFIFSFAI